MVKKIFLSILKYVLFIWCASILFLYGQSIFTLLDKFGSSVFEIIIGILVFLVGVFLFFSAPSIAKIFIIDPIDNYQFKLPLLFTMGLHIPLIIYFVFFKNISFSGINLEWAFLDGLDKKMFWFEFWKSFFVLPIFFLVSRLFHSDGSSIDSSYTWTLGNSNRGYRSATKKDVWNHHHRGSRTWEESQKLKTNIIFIVLSLGFYSLTFLNEVAFSIHITRFISFLFAGLTATAYLFLLNKMIGFDTDSLKFVDGDGSSLAYFMSIISFLIVIGLGLFHFIFFLIKRDFLFSLNFIWIPLMMAPLAWVLKNLLSNKKEQKDREESLFLGNYSNPDPLSIWAGILSSELEKSDKGFLAAKDNNYYKKTAERCNQLIEEGSYILYSHNLIDLTEGLILSLVRREPISIVIPAVYEHSNYLIETAQKLYFYYVNKYGHPIHNEVQEKLSRN